MKAAAVPGEKLLNLRLVALRLEAKFVDPSSYFLDHEVEYETIEYNASGRWDCGWDDEEWEDSVDIVLSEEAVPGGAQSAEWAWTPGAVSVAEDAFVKSKARFDVLHGSKFERTKAVLEDLARKLGCDAASTLIGND